MRAQHDHLSGLDIWRRQTGHTTGYTSPLVLSPICLQHSIHSNSPHGQVSGGVSLVRLWLSHLLCSWPDLPQDPRLHPQLEHRHKTPPLTRARPHPRHKKPCPEHESPPTPLSAQDPTHPTPSTRPHPPHPQHKTPPPAQDPTPSTRPHPQHKTPPPAQDPTHSTRPLQDPTPSQSLRPQSMRLHPQLEHKLPGPLARA
jgi:hypothetical protein